MNLPSTGACRYLTPKDSMLRSGFYYSLMPIIFGFFKKVEDTFLVFKIAGICATAISSSKLQES